MPGLTHRPTKALCLGIALLTSSGAWATCAPTPLNNDCQEVRNLTVSSPPPVRIDAQATERASGGWDYRYTLSVDNTAQLPFVARSWLLPVAPDAQLSDIQAMSFRPAALTEAMPFSRTDAGLLFDIQSPYPLVMPGAGRNLLDLARISFHSPYGPQAKAELAIRFEGITNIRTFNVTGVTVYETSTGITPNQPSWVMSAMPGSPIALSPVPEASAATLSVIGLAGLMALTRRGRKKPLHAGA